MKKCSFSICIAISIIGTLANYEKDICKNCVQTEKCPLFGGMGRQEQEDWIEKYSCESSQDDDYSSLFGFAPVAKGDYVCCPASNIWGIEDKPNERRTDNDKGQDFTLDDDYYDTDYNNGGDYESSRTPNWRRQNRRPGFNGNTNHPRPRNPMPPRRPNVMNNNFNGQNGPNRNFPNYNGGNGNFNRPNDRNFNSGSGGRNNYPNLNNPNGNLNNQGPNGQCSALTSFPPDPKSGCCGLDKALSTKITGPQNGYHNQPAHNSHRNFGNNGNSWPFRPRFSRGAEEKYGISLDNRITGGTETELEEYPWTVLLKTTFDYGNRKASFNCGGSIISARYILTAAHCVFEKGARVNDVEITLAEYDKRSFPRDCKNVLGQGRKCIDNIVMHHEEITWHPNYDDERLQNDIALIRLRGRAPYTDFIRPICLPPINIDNPEYSDIRLAVAGWGRNGSVTSQVKQSTIVNLVPQAQCGKYYPNLTNKHLCAGGHSGQDTCKGDSGGPLMMLYEGKYFVSGVVSGKRADVPCGASVPSLYTNVFHFREWIGRNIRN